MSFFTALDISGEPSGLRHLCRMLGVGFGYRSSMHALDPDQVFADRLAVVPLAETSFYGWCYPAWPGRAFGGQLAAQMLGAAAMITGQANFEPVSIHVHFHRPSAAREAIEYRVVPVHEGRTLKTVQVGAWQDGKLRATAVTMFGLPAAGPEHHFVAPAVTPPNALPESERLVHPRILPIDADYAALGYPEHSLIDLRLATRLSPSVPDLDVGQQDGTHEQPVWLKVRTLSDVSPLLSAQTMCYLSDVCLGSTALAPHGGRDAADENLQLGALELALWFHQPADFSQWTLFSQDSAVSGRGRAEAHGIFYSHDGKIAGVAIQNALMRHRS